MAAYLQQIQFVFIPFALLLIFVLVQYPQYLFYLLLAAIPWSFEYSFNPTMATDVPDEPLMLLAAVASITLFIYKKQVNLLRLHPLLFLILIHFFWTIITVILSTNMLISAKYLLAKAWYLLAFVSLPLFLFKNEKKLKLAAFILTGSMLLLMFVILAKHGQYNWSFEKVNHALHPFYKNHVTYSALLVLIVPLQMAFIRNTVSRSLRYFLIGILLISFMALYFSYARGAWIALFTGLAAYWLLKRKFLLPGFVIFFAICIGSVLWLKTNDKYFKFAPDYNTTVYHTDFREHMIATYQMKDVSTAERYYRWIAGIRMTKDSWNTGFGPGTFYSNYKSYTIPAFKTWVSKNEEHSTVHNYFLLLVVEQGVIGLLLFLLLVGCLFWHAQKIYHSTKNRFWKTVTATIAAILTMTCTVNFLSDLIETDKVGSIFYLCVATLIVADVKTKDLVQAETGNSNTI